MEEGKFEALMNPVRIRILLSLRQLGEATTREIAAACPDIASATLYRHLSALTAGGLLAVVRENRVNGIGERVYRLARDLPAEAEASGPEAALALLPQFLCTTLGEFSDYLSGRETVPGDCGFRYELLHLTEGEFAEFLADLGRCMAKYTSKEPAAGRREWRFTTVLVPTADEEKKGRGA